MGGPSRAHEPSEIERRRESSLYSRVYVANKADFEMAREFKRGDILGLSAVVSRSCYEVTARTIAPTILRRVLGEPFRSFLSTHVEASLLAAQTLAEAYRAAFADVRRLALSGSSAARLAGVLLEWATAESIGKPEMRLTMALSHTDLGNLVGCSRETVTRTLGEFRRRKLIAISRGFDPDPVPGEVGTDRGMRLEQWRPVHQPLRAIFERTASSILGTYLDHY